MNNLFPPFSYFAKRRLGSGLWMQTIGSMQRLCSGWPANLHSCRRRYPPFNYSAKRWLGLGLWMQTIGSMQRSGTWWPVNPHAGRCFSSHSIILRSNSSHRARGCNQSDQCNAPTLVGQQTYTHAASGSCHPRWLGSGLWMQTIGLTQCFYTWRPANLYECRCRLSPLNTAERWLGSGLRMQTIGSMQRSYICQMLGIEAAINCPFRLVTTHLISHSESSPQWKANPEDCHVDPGANPEDSQDSADCWGARSSWLLCTFA